MINHINISESILALNESIQYLSVFHIYGFIDEPTDMKSSLDRLTDKKYICEDAIFSTLFTQLKDIYKDHDKEYSSLHYLFG